MLVLSRKKGQSIELPGLEIVIRVVDVRKSKVQIGIEAPREFSIHRTEKQPQAKNKATSFESAPPPEANSTPEADPPADVTERADTSLQWRASTSSDRGSCKPKSSKPVGPAVSNGHSGSSSIAPAELERISGELMRLEAQFSATAELAGEQDLAMAQQVASDAIRRIEGIRRSLRLASHGSSHRPAGPLAELVRIRSDVLRCLRQETPPINSETETARETVAGYSIVDGPNSFSI